MSAIILPNGKQQFIDINGKPLVGGTVGMYIPNTLIPKNTWQDADQTILNTNPIILDERGQALIYGSGSYRQILSDSRGNLIWDEPVQGVGFDGDGVLSFDTTSDLLSAFPSSINLSNGTSAFTSGRTSLGDGGGSAFYYLSSDTTSPDNGGNIRVDDSGRRWIAPNPTAQYPGFNIRMWGAKGDGVTSDVSAFNAAFSAMSSSIVYIPDGEYYIDTSIPLPTTGITIVGSSETNATIKLLANIYGLVGTNATGITIENVGFSSTDDTATAIECLGLSTKWYLNNIQTQKCTLFHSNSTGSGGYSGANSTNSPNDINISNCRGYGNTSSQSGPFAWIDMRYGSNYNVTSCYCNYYFHGILFWGGDASSSADGATSNARKITDVHISTCKVENIKNGGIWGSMGQRVVFDNCIANTCGDVGFDFEGCFECKATGGYSRDGLNGCLATFWYNKNVCFENVDVTCSGSTIKPFSIHNPDGNSNNNESITFDGGNWTCLNAIAAPFVDAVRYLTIRNIVAKNIYFGVSSPSWSQTVENVTLIISENLNGFAGAAMQAGSSAVEFMSLPGKILIKNNTVVSEISQPSAIGAISVFGNNANTKTSFQMDGNTTVGFPNDYLVVWSGSNPGVKGVFIFRDNTVYNDGAGTGPGAAYETSALNGATFLRNNNYRFDGTTED